MSIVNISYSQRVLNDRDLPILLKEDTIVVKDYVWIQTEDSEVKQRAELLRKENKLVRLRKILTDKKALSEGSDTLIFRLNEVRDSLEYLKSIHESLTKEIQEVNVAKIRVLENIANNYKVLLHEADNKIRKLNKTLKVLIIMVIIETTVLIISK